jgi:tetratricopeptide (TPR) repeat protein
VIGLVQAGSQSMADRYSYIPSIGILMVLVWGVHQMTKGWHYQSIIFGTAGGVLVLACIMLTRHEMIYWQDGVSLWRRAVAVTENNYDAHNWLGRALSMQKRYDDAMREFQEAVKLKPGDLKSSNDLVIAVGMKEKQPHPPFVQQNLEWLAVWPAMIPFFSRKLSAPKTGHLVIVGLFVSWKRRESSPAGHEQRVLGCAFSLNGTNRLDERLHFGVILLSGRTFHAA